MTEGNINKNFPTTDLMARAKAQAAKAAEAAQNAAPAAPGQAPKPKADKAKPGNAGTTGLPGAKFGAYTSGTTDRSRINVFKGDDKASKASPPVHDTAGAVGEKKTAEFMDAVEDYAGKEFVKKAGGVDAVMDAAARANISLSDNSAGNTPVNGEQPVSIDGSQTKIDKSAETTIEFLKKAVEKKDDKVDNDGVNVGTSMANEEE